jgi:hypothetical protein
MLDLRPHCSFVFFALVIASTAHAAISGQAFVIRDGEASTSVTTDTEGQLLSVSGASSRVSGVTGSGSSQTYHGVNRVSAEGAILFPGNGNAPGYVSGYGYSSWTDTWTLSGLPAGTEVHGLLTGTTDYTFNAQLGDSGITAPTIQINQSISVSSTVTGGQVSLDLADFPTGTHIINWSVPFTARVGESIYFANSLQVYVEPSFCGTGCRFSFDAMHTSLTRGITFQEAGVIAVSQDAQLVATAGGFNYLAAAAVPEPGTGIMMCIGGLLIARWRFKSTAKRG